MYPFYVNVLGNDTNMFETNIKKYLRNQREGKN